MRKAHDYLSKYRVNSMLIAGERAQKEKTLDQITRGGHSDALIELYQHFKKSIDKMTAENAEILQKLEAFPDEQMRYFLFMVYIENHAPAAVAEKLGEDAKDLRSRALNAFEVLL